MSSVAFDVVYPKNQCMTWTLKAVPSIVSSVDEGVEEQHSLPENNILGQ